MIRTFREFFDTLIKPGVDVAGPPSEHALRLATAALLLETMRMDDRMALEEREAIAGALSAQFRLDDDEVRTLVSLAEQEARGAVGYHQFTSLINKGFSAEQKIRVVELMWQVAYADGHLDSHENHFMRKIGDLLHLPHAEFIAAKLRARDSSPASPKDHPAPDEAG